MRNIVGIVLAGGKGERIGGAKPLLPFGSATLIDAVIAVARPQVDVLALNVPASEEDAYLNMYGSQVPLLLDSFGPDVGPIGGIVDGLSWAGAQSGIDWLATFPCDTPFLPIDLVGRLLAVSEPGRPVAAEDAERLQGLCAIWPVNCLGRLRDGVTSGRLRSLFRALEDLGGTRCRFDTRDAFFNVNTREDLDRAEAMARRRN